MLAPPLVASLPISVNGWTTCCGGAVRQWLRLAPPDKLISHIWQHFSLVPVAYSCRQGSQEPVASRGKRLTFTSNWLIEQEQDPWSLGSTSQMMLCAHINSSGQAGFAWLSVTRWRAGKRTNPLQCPGEQVSFTFVARWKPTSFLD